MLQQQEDEGSKNVKFVPDMESQTVTEKEIDTINLEDMDAIMNTSFKQLLKESVSNHVGLIIGRVRTRDKANFRKKYYHNYYGPNLIKILFKTFSTAEEQILRSRYHVDFPLNAKDPLTNQVIVGEVEFYKIDADEIQQKLEVVMAYLNKQE